MILHNLQQWRFLKSAHELLKVRIAIILFVACLVVSGTHALSDGCSISGKNNVCCTNEGVGPLCAYCTAQCQTNVKGAVCDTTDASCNTPVDCRNKLTQITNGEPDLSFISNGMDTVSAYSWRDYFTNSAETNCPTFQCILRVRSTSEDAATTWSKYGVMMQNTDADAYIIHNEVGTTQVPFTSKSFDMICFTYYDASAANPEATGLGADYFYIDHYGGCDLVANFPAVANPPSLTMLAGSETVANTDIYQHQFQATSYISRIKQSCAFTNCRWMNWMYSSCSSWSTYSYATKTDDANNGLDFTTHFTTTTIHTETICLSCTATKSSGVTMTVESNAVSIQFVNCANYVSVTTPSSHTLTISDTADSDKVTLISSWTEFYTSNDAAYGSQCQPTKTQLYTTGDTIFSCTSDTVNTQTYAFMQCDGSNMGESYFFRNKVYTMGFKIVITASGISVQTGSFSITTVCASNSTTISEPNDIETSQSFQIHTGDYWNASQTSGYQPQFWFSPFQVSQSECAIQSYEIIKSQADQIAPSLLTMTEDSLASKKYVWVDKSVNYTVDSYTFTVKVTADGGATFYKDFSVNVVYDCIYDNITYISKLPTILVNEHADDMVMVGNHPVTKIVGTASEMKPYILDLKSLFTNNASTYCSVQQYKVSKVVNYSTGQEISESIYGVRMQLDQFNGVWQYIDSSADFLNVYIMFQAFNGKLWSNQEAQQLIQIDIQPKPLFDKTPPIFKGALFPLELTYDKVEFLKRDWTIRQWSSQKLLQIALPEIIEEDSLPLTVEFDANGAQFVTYDQKTNNITIDQSQIKLAHDGKNEVYFKLIDALENEKDYQYTIEIAFEKKAKEGPAFEFIPIYQDEIQVIKEEIAEEEEADFPDFEQADDPFFMRTKFDNNASIYLSFKPNKLMVSDKYRHELDFTRRLLKADRMEQVFKLELLPSPERDPILTGRKLDFTYSSYSLDSNNTIVIKIDFESPEDVSISTYSDRLRISIDKSKFEKTFIVLTGSDKVIQLPADEPIDTIINIPAQLPKEKTLKNVQANTESAQDGLKNSGLLNLFLSYLMNASFSLIWSALNILQIISFMVVSKLKIPAVTNVLYEQILKLVTFDVIPEEYYTPFLESLFNDLPSDYIYQEQVAQAGFETGYILVSMFLVFIFIFIFMVKAISHYIITVAFKNVKCCQKMVKKSHNHTKLVPAEIIRLSIELCLDISVCSFIEILMRQVNTIQERFSYYSSIFLVLSLVYGLLYSINLIKKERTKVMYPLIFEKFTTRWATIWEDQKVNFDSILPCFNIFFVIRRFVYASILIYALTFTNFTVYLQLVSILILNLLASCYLVYTRRFLSRKQQRIETFNETVNLLISIQFLALLQISEGRTLTYYGMGLNFSILFLFTVNVFFVFGSVIHDIYLKIKQYFERRAYHRQILQQYFQKQAKKQEAYTIKQKKQKLKKLKFVRTLISKNNQLIKQKRPQEILDVENSLQNEQNQRDNLDINLNNQIEENNDEQVLDNLSSIFSVGVSQQTDDESGQIIERQIREKEQQNLEELEEMKEMQDKLDDIEYFASEYASQYSFDTESMKSISNFKDEFEQILFDEIDSQQSDTTKKNKTKIIDPAQNQNKKMSLYARKRLKNQSIIAKKYQKNFQNMNEQARKNLENQQIEEQIANGQIKKSENEIENNKIKKRINAYIVQQTNQILNTIQEQTIEHELDSNYNR